MHPILNNPYRTVGLLAGSTAREQSRQIKRLKSFIEANQEPDDDFSFPALGSIHRTLDQVKEAESKLNLDHDKINAALFWFWKGNPISDNAAFDALRNGDTESACQIWNNQITETKEDGKLYWKQITEKNYSAYHNYSIITLIQANGSLHNAIMANLYFLQSNLVTKFTSTIADETNKTTNKELQLTFLNQILTEIDKNKKISLTNFLDVVKTNDFVAKQEFMKVLYQKPIEQIEQKIETAKNKRKSSKVNAAKAGQELSSSTSENLKQLRSVVGNEDIKFVSISDKVANEILQCSIDFFNESQEKESDENYVETAMSLAKIAENIAVGKLTKERIKDSINTLEDMKDKELSQAIELLKSVKDAYVDNQAKITAEAIRMPLGYNQTVNWGKVYELIEKSIDWDKVVDLIMKVIPKKNIEKIKKTNNPSQIDEFKNLVDFVISKLSFTQVNKVKYICYWKTENTVSNVELTVKSLPVWAKWCLGIAIFLLIVGLIWGEEGLSVVLGIAAFFGVMFLFGWLQNLMR